jgi:hypothetical protein
LNETGILNNLFSINEPTSSFILLILGIIVPVGGAIAFFMKLNNKVNNLQKDLVDFKNGYNEHPMISMFNQWVKSDGVFYFLNDALKNSKVEK